LKSDLDRLMAEYNLDAIVVLGDGAPNPYRDYLTRRAKADGNVFKKRDQEPVFVLVTAMEREEAAKSGLKIHTLDDFGATELIRKHASTGDAFAQEMFCNTLRQLQITGRVGFFGVADVNTVMLLTAAVARDLPNIEVASGPVSSLFQQAYATKDAYEIAELKEAGRRTSQIVHDTWNFIAEHRADGERVVDTHGDALTIGKVKQFIRLRQLQMDVEEPGGCIFGQGRDAGIPHSQGNNDETLQLGTSIVFDTFPRMVESGYFHDMTRTWCIGYAPPKVQAAYDEVLHIFNEVKQNCKVGQATSGFQNMVCDYFESKGHPTGRSQPHSLEGYVHSVGHGLGLNIHEAPWFRLTSKNQLEAGNVFTIEPGLYYPEQGYGVRIEDTVYLDDQGTLQTLTDMPYDLVLPLRG
jgi:Xaa-Pro aminopeptidase